MKNNRDIVIRFSLDWLHQPGLPAWLDRLGRTHRKTVVALMALMFICWHPGFIGSETLTLTTYYPAPYGGYVSILTTSQTLLARDGGNVGIGTPSPAAKLHVVGSFELQDGTQANGRLLTSDGNGLARWSDPTVPLDCSWQSYSYGVVTMCLGAKTAVVAARVGNQMYQMGPPGGIQATGEMLCCRLR
ncbi:MAG: hypothetical protein M0011_11915 [Elusimicrobia bacterium]|nr:hypothetical protein [Elusimicrobiota bacterium]